MSASDRNRKINIPQFCFPSTKSARVCCKAEDFPRQVATELQFMESMDVEEGNRPRIVTGEMEGWKKCLAIFFGIGILLMIIILPISFVGVEYYEVGVVIKLSL